MKEKALHILFTRHLKKGLQYVPIDFKNMVISGILDFNSSIGEYFIYHKRTSPLRPEFSRKDMKPGIIHEHFLQGEKFALLI